MEMEKHSFRIFIASVLNGLGSIQQTGCEKTQSVGYPK